MATFNVQATVYFSLDVEADTAEEAEAKAAGAVDALDVYVHTPEAEAILNIRNKATRSKAIDEYFADGHRPWFTVEQVDHYFEVVDVKPVGESEAA